MAVEKGRILARTVALGAVSAGLYALLYTLSAQLIDLSAQGRWMFVLPVAIAFLFSMVHGAFTGHFWDALGFKAKK